MTKAPYVPGSDTSRAAAKSLSDDDLARLERYVYGLVVSVGETGATDDELEVTSGLSHQTVSARRRTLVLKHKLRDSGLRRATRSGRKASVWVVGTDPTVVEGKAVTTTVGRPSADELKLAITEVTTLITDAKTRGYLPSKAVGALGRWLAFLAAADVTAPSFERRVFETLLARKNLLEHKEPKTARDVAQLRQIQADLEYLLGAP